jgi:hypothetical protein
MESLRVPGSVQAPIKIMPPTYRKDWNKKGTAYEENKLQEIEAVQRFFEKYKQSSEKNKIVKETAFTKFIDKCESFGIPPRPFGIV